MIQSVSSRTPLVSDVVGTGRFWGVRVTGYVGAHHLQARQEDQACRVLQLHNATMGLSTRVGDVIVLQEAQQSHRRSQVFNV